MANFLYKTHFMRSRFLTTLVTVAYGSFSFKNYNEFKQKDEPDKITITKAK